MKLRLLPVIAIAVVSPTITDAQQNPEWLRFTVSGTSASVGIPTAIFSEDGGPAQDGTGRRFTTPDGNADITVASLANEDGASPAAFLAARNPPSGIIYRRVTSRFFAVSSVREGRIWYNRCNRAPRAMNCVLINYPASEKRRWDGIVTTISHSLSGGA
jgi:hypothetical protein